MNDKYVFSCESHEIFPSAKHLKDGEGFWKIYEKYRDVWDKKNPDADQHRSHRKFAFLIAEYLCGRERPMEYELTNCPEMYNQIKKLSTDLKRAILKRRNLS